MITTTDIRITIDGMRRWRMIMSFLQTRTRRDLQHYTLQHILQWYCTQSAGAVSSLASQRHTRMTVCGMACDDDRGSAGACYLMQGNIPVAASHVQLDTTCFSEW